jgi:hypothetical protein
MKKIILSLAIFMVMLLPRLSHAENYNWCDQVSSFKFLDNKNYAFICQKDFKYFVVLNKKVVTKKYDKNIWEFAISKDLKNVAFTLENSTNYSEIKSWEEDIQWEFIMQLDYMVYLNGIPYKDFSYNNWLEFSPNNKDLYFIASKKRVEKNINHWNLEIDLNDENNILVKNGIDITPKWIKNLFSLSFSESGNDLYFDWYTIEQKQNIYKNGKKVFKYDESYDLNLVNSEESFIWYKLWYWYVIINWQEKYKSDKELMWLDYKENSDYYFYEKTWDNTYNLIKNSEKLIFWEDIISYDFSWDYSNYLSTEFSDNWDYNIFYNEKLLSTWSWWLYYSPYFIDNENIIYNRWNCIYDQNNEIIWKEFCDEWFFYELYISNNSKIKIIDSVWEKFKINNKLINTKWKFDITFLAFSPDSKKIWLEINDFLTKKVYILDFK